MADHRLLDGLFGGPRKQLQCSEVGKIPSNLSKQLQCRDGWRLARFPLISVNNYNVLRWVEVDKITSNLSKQGRKEIFYLTTHSTHFIYGYMASDMVMDHSDSDKGNPLPPHRLLFPNSKGSFICTIPQTG